MSADSADQAHAARGSSGDRQSNLSVGHVKDFVCSFRTVGFFRSPFGL